MQRFEVVAGRMRDAEALVRVDVTPALAMERMRADVVSLARAGALSRRGIPRSLSDLAALAGR